MRPVTKLGMLLLLTMTGCTISIQPWTKPQPPQPAPPSDGLWNPANLMKNGPPGQNPALDNARTGEMIRQLNEEQEMRKTLQEQVVALKKQIRDRESDLQTASWEMKESSDQIKKTREEFRHWQGEMDELRERIRKLEEYRLSAKPLIDDLYRFLDHEKEPGKLKLPPIYK